MAQKKQQSNSLINPGWVTENTLGMISKFLAKKCRHFYYYAKESLGHHKRDIVVCRVEDACDSLQETKDQFEDALERFQALIRVDSGHLQSRYNILKRYYDLSQNKAITVHDRIQAIEVVSEALFSEWEGELNQYTNRTLRSQSRQQLKSSRQQYSRLMRAMHRAEAKIQPVLSAFKDQVLFLKHNLNAQAIAALHHELEEISLDISQLIQAMENSIEEANLFVLSLVEQKALPDLTK